MANKRKLHTFKAEIGEVFHLGGIPYEYVGDGKFRGGTDPKWTRNMVVDMRNGTHCTAEANR